MNTDNILEQIRETLAEADDEFIEHIANQVLGRKVTFNDDTGFWMFVDAEEVEGV